jgi:WD40 repeat protein
MLSCSVDGLILFWEINKMEIKEIKMKNSINYEKSDEFIMNELKKKERKLTHKEDLDLNKYLQTQEREELKIYKCSPSVKRCINTIKVIKTEIKFYCMAFQKDSNFMTIFTGTNDHFIYLWDYKKENFISKQYGTNSFITCMIVNENYLFSGGIDGAVDVWNILANPIEKQINIELIKTINDPEMTGFYKPRINDLIILPKVSIYILIY